MDLSFIRLSAIFIITWVKVTSKDCLRFSYLQKGTWLHQIVWVVHKCKWENDFIRLLCSLLLREREFIRLSAMFIITKDNVTSSDFIFCSLLWRRTWHHHIAYVVHNYKRELDLTRLSAIFIITKGNVNSSDCLHCSLLRTWTWHHLNAFFVITSGNVITKRSFFIRLSAFYIITMFDVTSSNCLRCSLLQSGSWPHKCVCFFHY